MLNWKASRALHGLRPRVDEIEEYKVIASL